MAPQPCALHSTGGKGEKVEHDSSQRRAEAARTFHKFANDLRAKDR